jgi:hypothetical protein
MTRSTRFFHIAPGGGFADFRLRDRSSGNTVQEKKRSLKTRSSVSTARSRKTEA